MSDLREVYMNIDTEPNRERGTWFEDTLRRVGDRPSLLAEIPPGSPASLIPT